jgi:hypothetical protein
MTKPSPLEIALRLASRGVPVFPCKEDKRPATKCGFKDAASDERTVRGLWHYRSGPLVGVPTGPTSGIDVLDIDPRHGGDQWLLEQQHRLPVTWVNRTRSGGEHWLFAHTPGMRNSESKIAPGVDTRGEGGYIIWWPGLGGSVLHRLAPAQWPAWLLDLLLPKPVANPVKGTWRGQMPSNGTAARRIVQRQIERVAGAAPGQRHRTLRNAALLIGGVLDLDPDNSRAAIASQLLSAVVDAGGDDVRKSNAEATILWGLDAGASKPIRIGDRNG